MTGPNRASLAKGEVVIERSFPVDRTDLVRYAGAGGDFNPLHWDEATATSAGLPNVIAHGMFTMALGSCAVADWLGDPGAIRSYSVRFTRPVVVPADGQAQVDIVGTVGELTEDGARIDLRVTSAGAVVLGKARVVVALG